MDDELKALAAAPYCKTIGKINLPKGRLPAKREVAPEAPPGTGISRDEVKQRRVQAHTAKQEKLLDYYAGTDIPAERIAEHVGIYRTEEYKPEGWEEGDRLATRKVLDVERTEASLKWRRDRARP